MSKSSSETMIHLVLCITLPSYFVVWYRCQHISQDQISSLDQNKFNACFLYHQLIWSCTAHLQNLDLWPKFSFCSSSKTIVEILMRDYYSHFRILQLLYTLEEKVISLKDHYDRILISDWRYNHPLGEAEDDNLRWSFHWQHDVSLLYIELFWSCYSLYQKWKSTFQSRQKADHYWNRIWMSFEKHRYEVWCIQINLHYILQTFKRLHRLAELFFQG